MSENKIVSEVSNIEEIKRMLILERDKLWNEVYALQNQVKGLEIAINICEEKENNNV